METNGSWLRTRGQRDSGKVSMTELFFDLVFVFAVTQLSHTLLEHLDLGGFLRTSVLFLAVWWLWIFTSWCTNWLNPDTTAVRLLLFALMLGGLVLSSSIPQAFGAAGLAFGLLFAIMQVGRSLFMVHAFRGHREQRDNFLRMSLWLLLSGAFWLAGGMLEGQARVLCWCVALGIEYVSPALYFRVPGLGRSRTSDWKVDGAHLAERCMLFVIIALGESLLVTGATFSQLAWTPPTMAAFLAAFLGSVAMWWIYFDSGAEHGSHRIAGSDDPGRIARIAYTYLHLLIVAGIIVCAVADELVLMHPDHGTWVGLRAASFVDAVLPANAPGGPDLCSGCPAPCVSACPGQSFPGGTWDVNRCSAFHAESALCTTTCHARWACPQGVASRYPVEALAYHSNTFLGRRWLREHLGVPESEDRHPGSPPLWGVWRSRIDVKG